MKSSACLWALLSTSIFISSVSTRLDAAQPSLQEDVELENKQKHLEMIRGRKTERENKRKEERTTTTRSQKQASENNEKTNKMEQAKSRNYDSSQKGNDSQPSRWSRKIKSYYGQTVSTFGKGCKRPRTFKSNTGGYDSLKPGETWVDRAFGNGNGKIFGPRYPDGVIPTTPAPSLRPTTRSPTTSPNSPTAVGPASSPIAVSPTALLVPTTDSPTAASLSSFSPSSTPNSDTTSAPSSDTATLTPTAAPVSNSTHSNPTDAPGSTTTTFAPTFVPTLTPTGAPNSDAATLTPTAAPVSDTTTSTPTAAPVSDIPTSNPITNSIPTALPIRGFTIELLNVRAGEPGNVTIWDEVIAEAARKWEFIIVGDVPDQPEDGSDLFKGNFTGVSVSQFVDDIIIGYDFIDGLQDNQYGQGSWAKLREESPNLPYSGIVHFNSNLADRSPDDEAFREEFFWAAFHEIGHALGFGTMWISGPTICGGEACRAQGGGAAYGCTEAQDQFSQIFPDTTLTLDAVCGHWEQSLFNGLPWYDIMSPQSDMTRQAVASTITVGAMEDLGYEVNYGAADPLPAAIVAAAEKESKSGFLGWLKGLFT